MARPLWRALLQKPPAFPPLFDGVISADAVHVYKTAPAAYAELLQRSGVPAKELWLISSNRWDIAGAANAGLQTIWCNRSGQAEEYPELPAGATIQSLAELTQLLASS